jgi:ubiquitin carboxyl-terminal hydrolase 22/27/51
LRNYFLGNKHNPRWCKNKEDCACCELDRLFAATHSPPPQPAFGPTALLATTWRAAGWLAGYAQQDAHSVLLPFSMQPMRARGDPHFSSAIVLYTAHSVGCSRVICAAPGAAISARRSTLVSTYLSDLILDRIPSLGVSNGAGATGGCETC